MVEQRMFVTILVKLNKSQNEHPSCSLSQPIDTPTNAIAPKTTLNKAIQEELTIFWTSKSPTSKPTNSLIIIIMPRSRVRGITLYEGTRFHEAFFGQDDSLRESFDQVKEVAEFCRDSRNSRKVSTAKVGRLIVPRYVVV